MTAGKTDATADITQWLVRWRDGDELAFYRVTSPG